MAIAQVQTNKATNTTANASVTLSACVAGNLITIQARFNLAASGVTDPAGFSRDGVKDNAGAAPVVLIVSKVAAGGETTFTFTNASGGTWELEACEWSGTATSSPLDAASAGASGTAVTSLQPGSLTPGATGELMLAAVTQSAANGGEAATGSGWADQDQATFQFGSYAYKIKSDALAENPTLAWTTSRNAYGVQVAYKVFTAVAALLQRSMPRGVDRGVGRGVT